MNIQVKKYQLIAWITSIQDAKLIDRLEKIAQKSDWWNEISDTEKASVERGLKDLEEGRSVEHFEAKKLYEKYL